MKGANTTKHHLRLYIPKLSLSITLGRLLPTPIEINTDLLRSKGTT